MNVLIVGAGPTGLTAGIELARHGVLPTIVDKRDQASTLSRAVGITPRSLELLSHSGVSEKLIAEGIAMDGLRIYRGDRLALKLPLHSERMYFPTILGLAQDRTEAILTDVFASMCGDIRYGMALSGLVESKEGVCARFADGSEQVFDVVIGADGGHSKVRTELGLSYAGADLDQTWSIADVDSEDWRHPGKITLILAKPGTVIVVAPLSKTRYRVVASHEDALKALPLEFNVRSIRRESTFQISVRQAESYSKGDVHLAGDAAHCHSPVGGRGMNLGIADAVELAKQVVAGDTDSYSAIRHKEGELAIVATERGRKMAAGLQWQRRLAFRMLLGSVNALSPAKRRLGQFLVEF